MSLGSSSSLHLKWKTVDDLQHEAGKTVIAGLYPLHDLSNGRTIIGFNAPTQGIRKQLRGHAVGKCFLVAAENTLEAVRPAESPAIGKHARRIDRNAAVLIAPRSYRIVILEAKAQWIHARMTRGAYCIGPVLLQLLPQRYR